MLSLNLKTCDSTLAIIPWRSLGNKKQTNIFDDIFHRRGLGEELKEANWVSFEHKKLKLFRGENLWK